MKYIIVNILVIIISFILNFINCQNQLQTTKDEFNTTENSLLIQNALNQLYNSSQSNPFLDSNNISPQTNNNFPQSIRRILLRFNFQDCCPSWKDLTNNYREVKLELKATTQKEETFKKSQQQQISGANSKGIGQQQSVEKKLKPIDLLNELKKTFLIVNYLFIDGQAGENELDKYYNYYDNIQYFLRLSKVCKDFVYQFSYGVDYHHDDDNDDNNNIDFIRYFTRQLKSIEFKTDNDPTLSSFLSELIILESGNDNNNNNSSPSSSSLQQETNTLNKTDLTTNASDNVDGVGDVDGHNLLGKQLNSTENDSSIDDDNKHIEARTVKPKLNVNFLYYEDFLSYTKFGNYYAQNISIIRESVLVFNQISNHLTSTHFPSNFTRPSKQYEMIQRMSKELYIIRKQLLDRINIRIRNNRQDVKRLFDRLDELEQTRPYIKMLGDQFDSTSLYNYGSHVKKLTNLLDLYLSNNLTRISFYQQLSDLPEDFIVLGTNIANDYEYREIPQFTRLFEADYYNWPTSAYQIKPSTKSNESTSSTSSQSISSNQNNNDKKSSAEKSAEKRQSNFSLLTRLFS